jgi:transposase InsO family protein
LYHRATIAEPVREHREALWLFLRPLSLTLPGSVIRIERVMTDNGSCYSSKMFRAACKRLGLRQIFTRPHTPKTNGKAERFIQTALREWAYARAYQYPDQRSAELINWLHRYNWHRPHGSLKAKTPISRLGLTEDNLLRFHWTGPKGEDAK